LIYKKKNKIQADILYVKLELYGEEVIGEYRRSFQKGRTTVNQILPSKNVGKMLGTKYRCTSSIY
jgi:hypothetical protein